MVQIRFTEEHKWIWLEDMEGTVAIIDYAQKQLGDIVLVEPPDVGRRVEKSAEGGGRVG